MSELREQWTDKISTWRTSGQSMAARCRENNESYYRLTYWRKRLEQGTFSDGFHGCRELTRQQFVMLLEGVVLKRLSRRFSLLKPSI